MTTQRFKNPIDPKSWPDGAFWRRLGFGLLFGVLVTCAVISAAYFAQPPDRQAAMLAYWQSLKIEPGFRPEIFFKTPLSVQIHIAGVAMAILFSILILTLPKGTGMHRSFGWGWVIAMVVIAVTSVLMVRDFKTGINPLHIFTVITAVSLYGGLTAIRRGNVAGHAGNMLGLLIGGLIVAGVFAFIPGRTMWQMFFGG
jgi:uncharacterized membrane protein